MPSVRRVRATLLLLVCVGVIPALGQATPDAAPAALRLKSGKHYASSTVSARSLTLNTASSPSAHFIAVFQSVPSAQDAQELRQLGFNVLAFVPDDGLLVYGDPSADLGAVGVIENYSLQVADKLSAKLDAATPGALTAVVQMQPDVNAGLVLLRMLLTGTTLLPNRDLSATEYLVQTPYATLREIAGWDETAYVYPASAQMTSGQTVVPCSMGYSGGTVLGVAANLVPTFGDGWAGASHGSAAITYMLHASALPLAESDVRATLQSVIEEWSAYAAVSFSPTSVANASTSIDISFPSGDHGDGFPFTPSGAVLAHTFYPPPNPEPIAGDMHMNYDEAWSVDGSLRLYVVMLHEMGHALGLGHSDNPADVMYPYYQGTQHLASGDIAALRTLYAAPNASEPATPAIPIAPATPMAPIDPMTPISPSTPTTTPAAPSGGDKVPPLVQIYSPAMAAILTYQDSLTVQGLATDNVGVTRILWSNSAGGSGSASVASPFVISGIALVPGVNRILIQAYDAAGNVGAAHLNVTKK